MFPFRSNGLYLLQNLQITITWSASEKLGNFWRDYFFIIKILNIQINKYESYDMNHWLSFSASSPTSFSPSAALTRSSGRSLRRNSDWPAPQPITRQGSKRAIRKPNWVFLFSPFDLFLSRSHSQLIENFDRILNHLSLPSQSYAKITL